MTRPVATLFGHALKRWRTSRRMSQLDVATRAGTTTRHLSFLETGRSRPSQEMVLRLADALALPLSDKNALLAAGGFAAAFPERHLDDDALGPVRFVIRRLLASHAPYPAIVLDRWYDILDANLGGRRLFVGGAAIDPDDPPNLVDLMLGPLKAAVVNWDELIWDAVTRLRKEAAAAPDDARLADLLARVEAEARPLPQPTSLPPPVLFTRARFNGLELTTLSTLVHFGGSRDVTVDGLHLELVYPADPATDAALRALGAGGSDEVDPAFSEPARGRR